jgi:hypothetical protein
MKTVASIIAAAALGVIALGPEAASNAASPNPPQVEARAVDALAQMSAYLRSLPAFQITLQTQRDDVDMYGQLITLSGGATYKVRRPNAFAINLALPSLTGEYVYDGKTVTVYDAVSGVYSKFQAPATIRATLDLAKQKYGATVPLEDLFTWSEGDSRAKALTSAHYIGKTHIGGQTASQYAFRQPGVDWQIWIADGNKPTPLRVLIVASNDPARPQFRADLSWNTAPQFDPAAFSFVPPKSARLADARPAH